MNLKKILAGLIFLVLTMTTFLSYKNFKFDSVAIFKIEEQRREHIYNLAAFSRIVHNKATYFIYRTLEQYLDYFTLILGFWLFLSYLDNIHRKD